jgi:hypothetical protein
MPINKNDPAQDRYNPPGSTEHEWERKIFNELQDDEIFHSSHKPDVYAPVWRKQGTANQAMNVKTQQMHTFDPNTPVFVRI